MKKYAVIVAGGAGKRMGAGLPKQFLLLNGKPLLYYSIDAFLQAIDDVEIILVLHKDFISHGREIIDAFFAKKNIHVTEGGDTRFDSVKSGLNSVIEESIIFVHDAARCLISTELIHRCYDQAVKTGSAIPVLPSRDSVRLLLDDGDSKVLDRSKVVLIQTPQTFHSQILLPAFEIDYKDRFTDEATVVEEFGLKVSLIDGDERNIKITQPVDLIIAEKLIENP